jgi:hypothetical protein
LFSAFFCFLDLKKATSRCRLLFFFSTALPACPSAIGAMVSRFRSGMA